MSAQWQEQAMPIDAGLSLITGNKADLLFCGASPLTREEFLQRVHALAVPLRNLQGHTVAVLNVVASPKQIDEGSLQRDMLPLLQDAARELRGLL